MNPTHITLSTVATIFLLAIGGTSPAQPDLQRGEANIIAQSDPENSSPITVEDIQAINREVRELIDQEDVEGVIQYMVPFIISETITQSPDGVESLYIEGIEEHEEMLVETFAEDEAEEDSEVREIPQQETTRITPNASPSRTTTAHVMD